VTPLVAALLLALAAPATAQGVSDCGGETDLRFIVEPQTGAVVASMEPAGQ
jgi:hypothetical protein